jgi:hypothetical protein
MGQLARPHLSPIHIYWLSWRQGECDDAEAMCDGDLRSDRNGNAGNGVAGVPSKPNSDL